MLRGILTHKVPFPSVPAGLNDIGTVGGDAGAVAEWHLQPVNFTFCSMLYVAVPLVGRRFANVVESSISLNHVRYSRGRVLGMSSNPTK